MIDIVIPTMWFVKDFIKTLESYVIHPKVNKIIIIDNIEYQPIFTSGESSILAIINDDITVSHGVFDMVIDFNFKKGDLIGVNLRGYQDNYKIDDFISTEEEIVKLNYNPTQPIGGQAWAFGICMFMLRESYKIIPNLYQVWYGDDYLAQNSENIYAINSNKIKGKISETLKKYNDPNSDISKRIELDSKNLLKFNHFKDGKNWDIPKNMISMYESQRNKKQTVKATDIFEKEYQLAKSIPSDINENVHILYDLAKECKTVIEMGVRTGVSTRAFLNTDVELLSFDIVLNEQVAKLFDQAKKQGKKVNYIKENVLEIEIDETDLIFIDTLHTYDQLKQELKLHGNKAKKYIAFHDTYTFGLRGEDGKDKKGLMTAIIEFVAENPYWKFKIHKTNNNGFTVLERT